MRNYKLEYIYIYIITHVLIFTLSIFLFVHLLRVTKMSMFSFQSENLPLAVIVGRGF